MSWPRTPTHALPGIIAIALLCQTVIAAEDVDRRQLFATTVKGCVGVMTAGGPASGWIVDANKGWIITCHHVVGPREEVEVVFPNHKNGRLVQERHYYMNTATRLKGKVLSSDLKRDLCLIQVDALPDGA